MKRLLFPVLVPVLFLLMAGLATQAQAQNTPPTLTVRGVGETTIMPDTAHMRFAVETRATTAQRALRQNSRDVRRILRLVRDAGIPASDIQTANISVNAVYQDRRNNASDDIPKVIAFDVRNTLTITVKQVDDMGRILSEVVNAGGNRLDHIWFSNRNSASALTQARQLAVRDARRRARTYAKAANMTLHRLVSISEEGLATPAPMARGRMEMAASAPVMPGEQSISAAVIAVWELRRQP